MELFSIKSKYDKILSFAYIYKKEKLNPKNIYRIFKAREQIEFLNLFDEKYYLTKYSYLTNSNIELLNHYLYHGWKEEKNPSKKFDGNYYLEKYLDVKASKMNPLVHYVLHGKEEGRYPNPQAEINSPQNKIRNLENSFVQLNTRIDILIDKLNGNNKNIEKRKEDLNNNIENKVNQRNREVNKLSRELRKYTRVFTIGHINKEKIACEIEMFKGLGVTKEKRNPQIIVSLTSYPDRIYDIHYCLYSLLNQSFKPDKLILWLSKEEFPNLEKNLPSRILKLKKHGLEIKWTEKNFKNYDKLINPLKEYPDDFIVTADDDLYYPGDWLERLYENYDGENIIAHRAHLVSFESGSVKPYDQWEKSIETDEISVLNFPTTGGGVLYPPNVFYKDVLKDELFLKLTPHADDIWFWGMVVLNNRKIKVIKDGFKRLIYINPERELNLNDDGTLFKENVRGRNDEQLSALLEFYPEIKDKLLEEIDKVISKDYWENRYKQGDNSGVGSYGIFADFKASIINDFVKSHNVETVIEFGHGDGNQLNLANYKKYIGFDVSKTAVEMCRTIFKEDKTKSFYLLEDYDNQIADLALSLDVIFHLIEDDIFEEYMERLFNASKRYVIIYSSNSDELNDKAKHVKHRKFTEWVEKNLTNWKLINVIKNKYPYNGNYKESSFSDFYIYEKEIDLKEEIPPEVSVIIPVYNREKYLIQCLDSVINQTLKNIEIICINDGSTDRSLEILNEYGKKDGRIKIINQKNQGVAFARNIGLKIARGEYVGFVDSDDWIDLNFFETLFTEAKKEDADLARTLYVYEFQDHSKEGDTNRIILEKKSNGELLNVNEHSVVIWNAIYKREYLQKNNIYFDDLQAVVDVPFTAKATFYSKKTIPVVGTYYHIRVHAGNRLTIFNKKRIEEMLKANKITLDFINSVKYENKTDYLVAFKRVIWRYDDIFGRSVKIDNFDKKDQESFFNDIVQGFQSCKYKEDLQKNYYETYFEFLKKDSFNKYLKYQLQKD